MKSLIVATIKSVRLRIASSFIGSFILFRNFLSNATITETQEFDFSKALSDTETVEDTPSLSLQRTLEDSVNATDDIDANASLSDENNITFEKFPEEFIGISQSGLLVNQNYVDTHLYFTEDYVGNSRSL